MLKRYVGKLFKDFTMILDNQKFIMQSAYRMLIKLNADDSIRLSLLEHFLNSLSEMCLPQPPPIYSYMNTS